MKKFIVGVVLLVAITLPVFAEGQAEKGPKKVDVIAFTCQDLGNPFFKLMGEAVKDAAADMYPGAQVLIESGENDLNKQSAQIDDFISSGVDILVLNACDSEGIGPAVQRAKKAGIVVVASDVTAKNADAFVTSNNVKAGAIVAQYIVDRLNEKGNVIAIVGDPVSATLDREDGMREVFSKYPKINLLSSDQNGKGRRELSMNLTADLLTKYDKIDAIWGVNDPTALGAQLAVIQAGRESELFIVGVDGSPDAALDMAEKGSIFAASAAQDPYYMAYHAVEMAKDIIDGKEIVREQVIDVALITQKEVREGYTGWAIPAK